jgi:ubiquinone/menaquinone biosynthesis C-methylase UbiE
MSTYVFMKVLESAPERYDRGIRMLSGGAIDAVYARVAELAASEGTRIVDIGCGTGNLSLACAERGAHVTGIDLSSGMLEVARRKKPARGAIELVELGAMELEDRFAPGSFDAAVSCLAFSELEPEEQEYVLSTLRDRVVPGGRVVVADETLPPEGAGRVWHRLRRIPTVVVTYLITQTTTRPVEGLAERVRAQGFEDVREERFPGNLIVVSATNPGKR